MQLKGALPGPGSYQAVGSIETANESSSVNIRFPGFGQKEVRELSLLNKSQKSNPGPGAYKMNMELSELLQNCEDK